MHAPLARRAFRLVLAGALVSGAAAAWYYFSAGLTLSHYDARAHLVVARRVGDSLTPGWRQFGAVWLPLPHLLTALPVQWDLAYRTGMANVAVSVAALAWGLATFARYVTVRTGSIAAALAAPAVVALNPNVLYLQSTPMTEPLLLGLSLVAVAAVDAWMRGPSRRNGTRAGWILAALVMTRYEGWLIAAALVATATVATKPRVWWPPAPLWRPPVIAIAAFVVLGVASTGAWFISASFFVPDPELLHQPAMVAEHVMRGLRELGGDWLLLSGGVGLAFVILRSWRDPAALAPAALLSAALLPIAAFYQGHPYRVRYLVPLILALGTLTAFAIAALPRRARAAVAAALVGGILWVHPPVDPHAPMVIEAQWETPFRTAREQVTDALRRVHDGSPILASMGSLAHYMHEASAAGLDIRDFLHEGNGDLWIEALKSPKRSVRWVLVEEQAEGGDVLAQRARSDPEFLRGFERLSEGGGLVLYRRIE